MKLALSSLEIIDYWAPSKEANCSIITHLDYCLQDSISTNGYVRLIGNVSLDFFLHTDTSALSFFNG